MKDNLLVLAGAMLAGVAGYFLFWYLTRHGYYGLMIPGGCLGLGAGIHRTEDRRVPGLCAVLALALGLFTEWRFAPFLSHHSIGYFLGHVMSLQPVTFLMIGTGTLIGFWVPFRRGQGARRTAR